jgi:RNA polymerase sigma-70 factor (ECF subfamily)
LVERIAQDAENHSSPGLRYYGIIKSLDNKNLKSRIGLQVQGIALTSTSKNPAPDSPDPDFRDQGRALGGQSFSVDVDRAFAQFAKPLENFLIGILNNGAEASDALQATFVKLMEKGDTILQESAVKSWLFRVAYNEAMLTKRKNGVKRRHFEKLAWHLTPNAACNQPADRITDQERQREINKALDQLSTVQQEVVRKRIYEGLKFREIAEQLDIPLGTVLARMHTGLKKLKVELEENEVKE